MQHLAPVIEAVSDANSDMEDMEDLFPIDEPNPANLSGLNLSEFLVKMEQILWSRNTWVDFFRNMCSWN